jgi:hypothetical protein
MFELEITVRNGPFSGRTKVYEVSEPIVDFAGKIEGFPNALETAVYESDGKGDDGYFSMKLKQISPTGHVAVYIQLASAESQRFMPEHKPDLSLALVVEPNSIDIFQRQLLALAEKQEGTARLMGM